MQIHQTSSKKRARAAALFTAVLALAGCKADFSASADYAELFLVRPSMKLATLAIEVPSCYEQTTDFESSAVLELKARIPIVLPQARYLGCRAEDFTASAVFSTPVKIGRLSAPCTGADICIGAAGTSDASVVAAAGPDFLSGLEKVEAASVLSFEPSVTLDLSMNAGRDVEIIAPSLFINDEPHHFSQLVLEDGTSVTMTLSDAATATFFQGEATVIFLRVKELPREERL